MQLVLPRMSCEQEPESGWSAASNLALFGRWRVTCHFPGALLGRLQCDLSPRSSSQTHKSLALLVSRLTPDPSTPVAKRASCAGDSWEAQSMLMAILWELHLAGSLRYGENQPANKSNWFMKPWAKDGRR